MAIKVNARETELKIGKKPGYYYVMTPELYESRDGSLIPWFDVEKR